MRRALLPGMALALGMGCSLGRVLGSAPWALVPAAASLGLALWRRKAVWVWIGILLVGLALHPGHPRSPVAVPLLRGVAGRVVSFPEPHRRSLSFVLELPETGARLLVYAPITTDIGFGDRVALWGRGEVPEGGWGTYLSNRGIHGLFRAERAQVLARGKRSLGSILDGLRRVALGKLERVLPDESAALIQALLFGSRGLLPREMKEWFRCAGVAHLLALSGLHLGIITAGIWWGLGLLRLRPGKRYLVSFVLVALYIALAGMRVSLVRAGIMFGALGLFWLFVEGGLLLKSWYDPLQGLSLAALIVLSLWPWSASDLGFQLSFSATAAILIFWPRWGDSCLRKALPRLLLRPGDLLAVSLFAQAGTLGFVGSSFGYIPLYGPLANLLLIPWTALIIWWGLAILALPSPLASHLGALLGRFLIGPYLDAVGRIAALPGAVLPVAHTFGLWYALAFLALLSLHATRPRGLTPFGRR